MTQTGLDSARAEIAARNEADKKKTVTDICYWLVGPEYVAVDLLDSNGGLVRPGGFDEPLSRLTGRKSYAPALKAAKRIVAVLAQRYGVDPSRVTYDQHESAQYAFHYKKGDCPKYE